MNAEKYFGTLKQEEKLTMYQVYILSCKCNMYIFLLPKVFLQILLFILLPILLSPFPSGTSSSYYYDSVVNSTKINLQIAL